MDELYCKTEMDLES